MGKLAKGGEGDCKNEAKRYVIKQKTYVCEKHFVDKYFATKVVSLISADALESKINKLSNRLNDISKMPNYIDFEAGTDDIINFAAEFTEQVMKVQKKFKKALSGGHHIDLLALKTEIDKIQDGMKSDIYWSTITDKLLWYKDEVIDNMAEHNTEEKKVYLDDNNSYVSCSDSQDISQGSSEGTSSVLPDFLPSRQNKAANKIPAVSIKRSGTAVSEKVPESSLDDYHPQMTKKPGRKPTEVIESASEMENSYQEDPEMMLKGPPESSICQSENKQRNIDEAKEKDYLIKLILNQEKWIKHDNSKRKPAVKAGKIDSLYEEMFIGVTFGFEDTRKLVLDFSIIEHLELIKLCENDVFPDGDEITMKNVSKDSCISDFLKNGFPNKVKNFHFSCDSERKMDLDYYLSELMFISHRVEDKFIIYNCKGEENDIKSLFGANKNKIGFGFSDCVLNISPKSNFSHALEDTTIKELCLDYCGAERNMKWGSYPERFTNLLKALSTSEDLKKSLEIIGLDRSGLKEGTIRDELESNYFKNVEIVGN